MRTALAVMIGPWAVMGVVSCGNGSDGGPVAPTSNAETIAIVANNGSQSFSPNPAHVGGEGTVWRNDDGETHRIVANDGAFDTGNIAPGGTSAMIQMPTGGTNYHCEIHPTMLGAIGGSGGEAPPACTDALYCE